MSIPLFIVIVSIVWGLLGCIALIMLYGIITKCNIKKVYHDGDGKLYCYKHNGEVDWLFEVFINDGDSIARIINRRFLGLKE